MFELVQLLESFRHIEKRQVSYQLVRAEVKRRVVCLEPTKVVDGRGKV